MNLLDNRSLMQKLDESNQLNLIQQWDQLLNKAIETGSSVNIPKELKFGKNSSLLNYKQNFSSIAIFGMGGSAISGDYLASVLFHEKTFDIPIQVIRGYNIPKWINFRTLVIGVSYSGNTRETLTCIFHALNSKAPIILLSSGGVVEEVANKYSLPLVNLPGGYQPRAAFPIIFGSILGLFIKLFPQIKIENQLINLNSILQNIININGPNVPLKENDAKQLAVKLEKKIPLVISSESSLAMRWKGQINENAKMIASFDIFPELMHNTIQGWENDLLSNLEVIVLKLNTDSNEIIEKNKFCLKIANENVKKDIHLFEYNNKFLVENLVAATLFGDLVSIYLAFLQSLDPSKIRLITEMKNEFEPKLSQEFNVKEELLSF
ncbi:MAG: bifunctional phosphoglucose/phosphomannose isomerase [Candidatus Hodarchaeales archaeon]